VPGKFLAEFELYVMLAITHLGDDAYGAAIRRAIEERTERPVSIGALYATLARLEEKGLLNFTVSEPQPVRGGRAKKNYKLTRKGQTVLNHSTEMLSRMMQGIALTTDAGSRP
jgi:DNA-binding PadR family transcriptional regulator